MPFPRRLLNQGEDVAADLHPHWIYLAGAVAWLVLAVGVGIAIAVMVGSPHGLGEQILDTLAGVIVLVALGYFGVRYAKWTTTHFVVTSQRIITGHGVLSKNRKEIPLDRINDVSFHQRVLERMVGAGDLTVESAGERGQETFSDVNHPDAVQQQIYRQMEAHEQRKYQRYQQAPASPPAPPAVPAASPPAETPQPTAPAPTRMAPSVDPDPSPDELTRVVDSPPPDPATRVPAGSSAGADATSIPDQIQALHGLYQRGVLSQQEFEAKKAELLRRM